ncbi:MAG: alpha/beta hydrolase [Bacteroidota bacterium]
MIRAVLASLVFALTASAQTALTIEPYTFETRDGRTAEADLGRFLVPENRQLEDGHPWQGRTLELAFVRFPSTSPNPGPPIVYLAGGPGGSGTRTAQGTRFDLFQSLREVADVIAFDQRGTGLSESPPRCPHQTVLPLDVPGTRASYTEAAVATAQACVAHWQGLGVDLAAYTTDQSADDLEALRQALGVPQISLWAISYGTHLALATLRRHPESIAAAVLAGVEGPDHTFKLPSHQQALLEEINGIHQAENSEASSLLADMEAVIESLRRQPVVVDLGGETGNVAIGAFDVQWIAANMLGGPELSMQLPEMFAEMRSGDFEAVARWLQYLKAPSGVRAMSFAMDAASGASIWRRAQIATEAEHTLLGDAINFPAPEQAVVLRHLDLGPAFRQPVQSHVPTLFISGTLDGRTLPANADEVRAGFSDHAHLVIEGAGHSDPLFLSSPVILDRMRTLLAGGTVESERISMAP